jgi:hypothetical protein
LHVVPIGLHHVHFLLVARPKPSLYYTSIFLKAYAYYLIMLFINLFSHVFIYLIFNFLFSFPSFSLLYLLNIVPLLLFKY